jgi:hypothetical protein
MIELNKEQKEQFSEILELLGESLDISQTEYDKAVESYKAVGNQLAKENSKLKEYNPQIAPQGSFLLGTMIKAVNDCDDLDIDLVCELLGKNPNWTQEDLKAIVGGQLIENEIYNKIIERPDGRRCWTLKYRQNSENEKYHMDILPSVIDSDYKRDFRSLFSEKAFDKSTVQKLAFRITDRERDDYKTETDATEWLKSNPFGYAKWFFDRAEQGQVEKRFSLKASIQDVPNFQKNKYPLQRIVQILKRHRDIIFSEEEEKKDKPISIIITTLVSRAYIGSQNVLEALENVISNMKNYIEIRINNEGKKVFWIENPVNSEENFADKWEEYPQRQTIFYNWLEQVRNDIIKIKSQNGLNNIGKELKTVFGDNVGNQTINRYSARMREKRENNNLRMTVGTAMLGNTGKIEVPQHKFYGK